MAMFLVPVSRFSWRNATGKSSEAHPWPRVGLARGCTRRRSGIESPSNPNLPGSTLMATLTAAVAEITNQSATALARQIAAGELSAVEVVKAHLRRIEDVNPRLNALIVPLFDQARADAQAA